MDDLNKNQFVLLILLVSFVTSIATGIMTVSLLQQAPVEVTRTINQVVEKTIETVTPPTVTSPAGQKQVTTVVVKEEDSIIAAINKNMKSIVRITEKTGDGVLNFYGIGLVISKDGSIAADRKKINSTSAYRATMSDGTEFELVPQGAYLQTNFILFKPNLLKSENIAALAKPYVFVPATWSEAQPQLGQSLVSIGGEKENAVAVGRVVSLDMKETGSTTPKTLTAILTDISLGDLSNGSPLFNLSGDIVGVKISSDSSKSFMPISVLKKEIVTLSESTKVQ